MSDCIFCKIAAGEFGTSFVAENELACAFEDLNPQAPVHVLVVPRAHHANLLDDVSAEELAAMRDCVEVVAEHYGLRERGFRLIANTGSDAGQTVEHLHWHILGGTSLGEGLVSEATKSSV